MQLNPKLLECLFGHHDYGDELTKDKDGFFVYLCKICKKHGCQWLGDESVIGYWCDYDEEGTCIHERWRDGCVRRYDKGGVRIYEKYFDGRETWFVCGYWTNKKPKNWKYEKCITN